MQSRLRQFLSVLFSFLLMTSLMGPAMAASPGNQVNSDDRVSFDVATTVSETIDQFWSLSQGKDEQNGNENGQSDDDGNRSGEGSASSQLPDVDENRSALYHRNKTVEEIERADIPGNTREQKLLNEVNDTYEYVLDENRVVNATVYKSDKTVAAQMRNTAPNATAHLLAADAQLSSTAIGDVENTTKTLHERNITFDERAVDDELADAKQAFQKAERLERRSPAAAIEQYRDAWIHAQRALDLLDEATEPNVTIETRQDMPHDEPIEYNVSGTVFDVRPYELNASVTVRNETRQIPIESDTEPASTVRFNATVALQSQMPNDTRAYEITVEVSDPGTDVALTSSKDWDEVHHHQRGADRVRLDGDGLPDTYEEATTGTDPLDPDSNSTFTSVNESGVGTLDGVKDFDEDELITYREYRLETDPVDPDTDGDALLDGFEVDQSGTDPNAVDTAEDGVNDSKRDLSGDGLTLIEEQEHGTNPHDPDTDSDGLTDYEEVHEHGTEPLESDTDDDHLPDGDELRVGTDPLRPDTSGNGILDGNETFTTTTTHNESGVSVAGTGNGVVADGITVREQDAGENSTPTAGPMVLIQNRTEFDSATVTLPVNETVDLDDGANLTVYKWDPQDERPWHPVSTVVDEENRTVSANVSSFSYFTVMGHDDPSTEATASPGWPTLETFDDVDGWTTSGAVTTDDGYATVVSSTEDGDVCSSTEDGEFESQDYINPGGGSGGGDDDDDDDDGGDVCSSTADDGEFEGQIVAEPLPGGGGGDDDGDDGDDGDGDDGSDETVPSESTLSRTVQLDDDVASIKFHTLAFPDVLDSESSAEIVVAGEDSTKTVFRMDTPDDSDDGLAPDGGGFTVDVSEFAGQEVTVRVRTEGNAGVAVRYVAFVQDADGDGIPDVVEEMSLKMPVGENGVYKSSLNLDPTKRDTDGDELHDGEEVDVTWSIGQDEDDFVIKGEVESAIAHPDKKNTDGGGLNDKKETVKGSDPLRLERLIVKAELPTWAQDDGYPEEWYGGYRLMPKAKYTPKMQAMGSPPEYIEQPEIEPEEDCPIESCTYVHVQTTVYMIHNFESNYELPSTMEFNTTSESGTIVAQGNMAKGNLTKGRQPHIIEGAKTVDLVIRITGNISNDEIGAIEFGMYTDKNSQFYRENHDSKEQRDGGAFTYVNTNKEYTILDLKSSDTIYMTGIAMKKWEEGMEAVISVYTPSFFKIRVRVGTSPAGEAVFEGLKIIMSDKISKNKGSVRAKKGFTPEVVATIKDGIVDQPVTNTGPVIVREN